MASTLEESLGNSAKVTLQAIGAQEAALLAIAQHTYKLKEAMEAEVRPPTQTHTYMCTNAQGEPGSLETPPPHTHTQACTNAQGEPGSLETPPHADQRPPHIKVFVGVGVSGASVRRRISTGRGGLWRTT